MLNAFRHQRFLREDIDSDKPTSVYECSTPFGIKDSCGRGKLTFVPFEAKTCSTPFGIKDSCGGAGDYARYGSPVVKVLNAFRHQRFLRTTPTIRSRSSSRRGAQRLSASKIPAAAADGVLCLAFEVLNAFRHQRFLRPAFSSTTPSLRRCAQRLSASKIPAVDFAYADDTDVECSTPFGIKDSCGSGVVVLIPRRIECSTPFGIKDSCGPTGAWSGT